MWSFAKFFAVGTIGILYIAPSTALAWGVEGHQIIAAIAASELTPNARAAVADLLGQDDVADAMVTASTWADEVRPSRPETRPWHYVNIELSSTGYDAARDCPNDACVVGQIQRDLAIVRDKTLAKPVRAEALRFLIHFVGDLHQPLHAADNNDRGGNEVRVVLDGQQKNLHAVWDTDVVEALGTDPRAVATELERLITPQAIREWSHSSVVDWANQSFQVARTHIYGPLSGAGGTQAPIILASDYTQKESPITRIQLERAGVRLATLLNRAFGK